MKKSRKLVLSVLLAMCAVCLSFAIVGCSGGGDDKADGYGYGEEGFYYYDGADSSRYMLSLQSGTYMMTVNGASAYSGTYSYDGESGTVSFKGDNEFAAMLGESALSLNMAEGGYSFKAYKFFDVTYVDENGEVVYTDSVLNGQCAEAIEIEKDGYWFIDWYVDAADSAVYSFDTSIAGDTTIYGWYIEKNAGATEHTITLDYGDGHTETMSTTNGAVYKELPTEYDGESILGWWVSATNKSGGLTCEYVTGEAFDADTTLFAVYSGIGSSVTTEGVTWDTTLAGSSVTVAVYDSEGVQRLYETVSSSMGSFSSSAFTALGTGVYTVEIISGNVTDTRVYVVNGLSRVTLSDSGVVQNGSGRVLSFAPVEGADGYVITVTNGERTVTEDLGSHTYYNFSDWAMTKEGITFVVTAYGEGYIESESNAYTYIKVLDDVTVSVSDDVVSWNRVEGAIEYAVTISDVDGVVVDFFYTSDTSFSLKYYENGTYDITVQPRTDGYYSEAKTYYGYAKDSLAAPQITDVTNYTVSWTEIKDADSYVVLINGTEYEVKSGTTLNFGESDVPETAGSYEISVKAVKNGGTDSPYSDAVVATVEFSPAVSYDRNMVYWNYDIEATSYGVSVNGGTEEVVTEGDSAKVILTRAGDNTITVTAYKGCEAAGFAETTVYAYPVILDPNGATLVSDAVDASGTIYVAQGDELNLGTVEKENADFVGWYTQADYTEGRSDEYEGKGSLVEDGSTFTGNGSMYLYAYWTYRYFDVTLVVVGGTVNGASEEVVKIKYNSTSFTLPVAVPDEATDDFGGWFTSSGGGGTQYTLGSGVSTGVAYAGDATLYAYFLTVFVYSQTRYNGETVYAVSAGQKISQVTEVTVPEQYNGCNLVLNSGAFENCTTLVTINIPDTVMYIAMANNGYKSGSGAFAGCTSLQNVNVYATDYATERMYFSADGVLFRKISDEENGDVEVMYYPHGREVGAYAIPSAVSNDRELDAGGSVVSHKVTNIPAQVFTDKKISQITIPSTITNVTSGVFDGNIYLETVIFEDDGVTSLTIQSGAFKDCWYLSSVTLPSRLTDFDGSVFEGCTSLMNVSITSSSGKYTTDSGVLLEDGGSTLTFLPTGRSGDIDISTLTTTTITKIGDDAFAANKLVTGVTIPGSVTYIGVSAFENCKGVTSVTFEGTDNSPDLTIKSRAFYGLVFLTEVTLPSNLTTMEANAFGGCVTLNYVKYDARAEGNDTLNFAAGSFGTTNHIYTLELGKYVPEMDIASIFDGGLISKVIIEDGNDNYISDDYGVVYGKTSQNIVYCPPGLSGDYVMREGATQIDATTFADKVSLTSVTVASTVNTIADGAFDGCVNLGAIYVAENNANFANDNGDGILYGVTQGVITELIYCPVACKTTEIKVASTITKVDHDAFYGNATVVSVSFEGLTQIEFGVTGSDSKGWQANTFYNCTALTTVVLPADMTKIPAYMFYGCSKLVNISIPSGVTTIETYAFYNCKVLTGDLYDKEDGITLPSGLTTIGDSAFQGCTYLTVTIPNTVTTIGTRAFQACWSNADVRSKIVFESDGTEDLTIGQYAFYNTVQCTGVEIPARVTSVDQYSFAQVGMSAYSSVDIEITFETGSKLTSLPTLVFTYTQLKSISIPASVKTIENNINSNNASLASVTFEGAEDGTSNLTEIGDSVFSSSKITEVVLPASLTTIGTSTFATSSLTSVTFAENSKLTTIGEKAFNKASITEMEIPASVTSLGSSAFASCTSLQKVTFGEGCTLSSIGESCFSGCTSLSDITLPASLKTTGSSVFDSCSSLASITIPVSVTTISSSSFNKCTSLAIVIFEEGTALSSIAATAFSGCTSLTSAYTSSDTAAAEGFVFPETSATTLSLGDSIFSGCTSLKSVTLSSKISSIGTAFVGSSITQVFVGNNTHYKVDDSGQMLISLDGSADENIISHVFGTLAGAVTGLDGVTTIGSGALAGQTEMTSVVIPSSVTSIGASAFDGCTKLVSVTFEEGSQLTSIGANAFDGCTSLVSIEIPSGVKTLGNYAFTGCTALTTVTFADGSTIPDSGLGTYVFDGCKALTSISLPSTVTTLPTGFFRYCDLSESSFDNITSVGQYAFRYVTCAELNLPRLTSVSGTYAFANSSIKKLTVGPNFDFGSTQYTFYQSAIEEIELPSTVTSIPGYTFRESTALKYIELPSGVGSIATYAFYSCTSLEEIVIPESVTSIGTYAFQNCSSLKAVDLPSNLTSLGSNTFYGCSSLKSVTLPQNVTSIGSSCFYQCTSLSDLQFNDKLTSIGNGSFRYCSALTELYIPSGVTLIDGYGFGNCTGLTYVYIGDSPAELRQYCFSACTSLETVVLGPEVHTQTNPDHIFNGCSALKEVNIPAAWDTIPTSTFASCTSLESVFIPASVVSISSNAFSGCTCDIFVENTEDYANANWTSSWAGNATVYYFSQSEPAFNSDGTGYNGNYWYYDADFNVIAWTFEDAYTIYTATDGNYVVYSVAKDAIECICFVSTETVEREDDDEPVTVTTVTLCMAESCETDGTAYTVTLSDGDSYTVVLTEEDGILTATMTKITA